MLKQSVCLLLKHQISIFKLICCLLCNHPCGHCYVVFTSFCALCSDRNELLLTAVSRVEHGVLHLVDPENSEITVLVDCEGLSPFKIPMQVLRTCSTLLQDHFPNRLGCLFVIRLPPVLRVIAQTFIQVTFSNRHFCTLVKLFFFFSFEQKRMH